MTEIIAGVNWLAVIVGAIVAFVVGGLWYSPKLFGRRWAEGVGISMENASGAAPAMITQAGGTFLLAWVVGVTAANNALLTIILIVVTIVALLAAAGIFAQKKNAAIAIETAYVVVMAVIMITCQAIF